MAEKQKPGVMLYFDLRPCLQRLTNEQRGVLFTAILDYAESGVLPELVDVAVGIAWDFVKPRIDRDAEAYAGKVEKARAAINKRWATQANTDVNGGIRENTDEYQLQLHLQLHLQLQLQLQPQMVLCRLTRPHPPRRSRE